MSQSGPDWWEKITQFCLQERPWLWHQGPRSEWPVLCQLDLQGAPVSPRHGPCTVSSMSRWCSHSWVHGKPGPRDLPHSEAPSAWTGSKHTSPLIHVHRKLYISLSSNEASYSRSQKAPSNGLPGAHAQRTSCSFRNGQAAKGSIRGYASEGKGGLRGGGGWSLQGDWLLQDKQSILLYKERLQANLVRVMSSS